MVTLKGDTGLRPLELQYAVLGAKAFDVPLKFVTGVDMYDNWRRRVARLNRARLTATTTERRRALRLARERLGGQL